MAYKQKPGRGNQAKTGHGIPAPFKQMEFIKAVGSKIGEAHEAGKKAFDESIKPASFMGDFGGGSGVKRSYSKNGLDYVTGFVKSLVSEDNPKTNEKKKLSKTSTKLSPAKK